jgi:hypothetical protein
MSHPLHRLIGQILVDAVLPDCEIVRTADCGGDGTASLFSSGEWSDELKYAEVDMLLITERESKGRRVQVIIEIEESGLKPSNVLGKFLASAFSSHFIARQGTLPVEISDSTSFIQILDTSSLNIEGTAKISQWEHLEQALQAIVGTLGGKIARYKLFYGNSQDFQALKEEQLVRYIAEALHYRRPDEKRVLVEIPAIESVLANGCSVPVAREGESWSTGCLGGCANLKGVYVIHHSGRVKYVGKTEKGAMSFGMRLRREFTEKGSSRRHIYPKLEALLAPPEIKVCMFPLDDVRKRISTTGFDLSDSDIVEVFEIALKGAYRPEFQVANEPQ